MGTQMNHYDRDFRRLCHTVTYTIEQKITQNKIGNG